MEPVELVNEPVEQGKQNDMVAAPTAEDAVPTGHSTQSLTDDAPSKDEKVPARQSWQVSMDDAPVADEYVPAGHPLHV